MSAPSIKEPTPVAKPGSRWAWRNLKGRFLIISVAFHIVLALVATYLVVTTLTPRKPPDFKAGPKATANKAVEHKINMAKQKNSMSAPMQAKKITTTGLSKVALPDMPTAAVSPTTPSTMSGMGGMGVSSFGGMGNSSGSGTGGGGMPFFGLRESSRGLPGNFYDLKQTRGGTPTDMAVEDTGDRAKNTAADALYAGVVGKFIDRGMGEGVLGRYFVGPAPLYATQIYIPNINADEAPKAFSLEGKALPRRWIVIYKGTVTAPESGKYQLVGGADDYVAVRFNGRLIFNNRVKTEKSYRYDGVYQGGASVSAVMDVKANVQYPMDILIGEQPGGAFLAYLLIEKIGAEYSRNAYGSPILPILKFAPSKVTRGKDVPEFAPDTSWSIWKAGPPKR